MCFYVFVESDITIINMYTLVAHCSITLNPSGFLINIVKLGNQAITKESVESGTTFPVYFPVSMIIYKARTADGKSKFKL